jgi:hypothetical protein
MADLLPVLVTHCRPALPLPLDHLTCLYWVKMAQLTSLQLIAGAELANNQGIQINSNLSMAIAQYRSTDLIDPLKQVYANVGAANLSDATIDSLTVLGANVCPSLADTTPSDYAANVGLIFGNTVFGNSVQGFTGIIENVGNYFLGNGDVSIFSQIFSGAQGYIITTNDYILTSKNSNNWLAQTFTNMNNLITGSLSEVNLAFSTFGQDLSKLGLLINLGNVDNLGSPLALCQQLSAVAEVIPNINLFLLTLGYDPDVVNEPPEDQQQLLQLEKNLYEIFLNIKNQDLQQVLQLLGITLDGIDNMAELLNPIKIFPNSFSSLTVRTVEGLRGIYMPGSNNINSLLITELPPYIIEKYQQLATIIPADQALACQALRASLQQIKNINNLSLPQLAEAYNNSETTRDLPLINQLTQPVPESVINFYSSTFGTGTGVDHTIVIGDMMGVAAGFEFTNQINNTTSIINSLTNTGSLANLIIVYDRMANTVNGEYGDPVTGPVVIPAGIASGSYTNADEAFSVGLIPNANIIINAVSSNNVAQVVELNQYWDSMAANLISQNNNLLLANVDIANLIPDQRSAILSFVNDLPNFGVDTQQNGLRSFIEAIADLTTLGGQSIIGCMREGKNIVTLNQVGIGIDLTVPAIPTVQPKTANLIPSNYSESQAANLIIT